MARKQHPAKEFFFVSVFLSCLLCVCVFVFAFASLCFAFVFACLCFCVCVCGVSVVFLHLWFCLFLCLCFCFLNFSGTDESVLLGFARVSERMWVAPSFGSFACSYA